MEREQEKAHGPGALFYWGQGWGPWGLQAHSLLVDLKCGREKNEQSSRILKAKEPQGWEGGGLGSSSSCVSDTCLLKMGSLK